jgi:hypothetical protein
MKSWKPLAAVTILSLSAISVAHAGTALDAIKKNGYHQMRRQRRPARFLLRRRKRQLQRHRCGRVPRRRRCGVRRFHQAQVHPADRQGASDRPAIRRDRRAVAQHHLDLQPRFGPGSEFRRSHLLRRPGLSGQQETGRQERQEIGRRYGLRPGRHHHRTQL